MTRKKNIRAEGFRIGGAVSWDHEKMARRLRRLIQKDPQLREQVIAIGIDDVIRLAEYEARSTASASPRSGGGMTEDKSFPGLVARGIRKTRDFLAMPIGKGVILADARREEMKQAIDIRVAMASGNIREARFLEALMKRLPDDRTRIGEVLTNEEIAAIQAESREEAA